jgi:hypothetical protein
MVHEKTKIHGNWEYDFGWGHSTGCFDSLYLNVEDTGRRTTGPSISAGKSMLKETREER